MAEYNHGECLKCGKKVKLFRQTPSHLLHLFLTIFTVGIWGVMWFFLCIFNDDWQCNECGTTEVEAS